MTTARIGDAVAVEWEDAWCDQGETSPSDWKDDTKVTTYGILLRRGKIVTVGSEVMPDGQYRATTHIPRAIVSHVRRLS